MGGLWIDVEHVNASENYRMGSEGLTETDCETTGDLFRLLTGRGRRYESESLGRCTGKVYIDPPEGGEPQQVGWVFVKADKYEDTGGPFLHETWVTVQTEPPTVTTVRHYATF